MVIIVHLQSTLFNIMNFGFATKYLPSSISTERVYLQSPTTVFNNNVNKLTEQVVIPPHLRFSLSELSTAFSTDINATTKPNTLKAYKDTSGPKVQLFKDMCRYAKMTEFVNQKNLIHYLVYNALRDKKDNKKKVKFDEAHYLETLKGIKESIHNPKELLLAKENRLGKEAMRQALNAIKALHYEQVAHGVKNDSWDNIYNGLPFQIVTICDK